MRKNLNFTHEFVEHIPKNLDGRKIYISIHFGTVVHLCACGCGNEIVTPLSPTDWALTYNGETISLSPSIGNWGFTCQSHYWIENDEIRWSYRWSQEEIEKGRARDQITKGRHFTTLEGKAKDHNAWSHLKKWLSI